jgi:hypothetical protein
MSEIDAAEKHCALRCALRVDHWKRNLLITLLLLGVYLAIVSGAAKSVFCWLT